MSDGYDGLCADHVLLAAIVIGLADLWPFNSSCRVFKVGPPKVCQSVGLSSPDIAQCITFKRIKRLEVVHLRSRWPSEKGEVIGKIAMSLSSIVRGQIC